MKIFLILVFFLNFTNSVSAAIICEKVKCTVPPTSKPKWNFCIYSTFQFSKSKDESLAIRIFEGGRSNDYFADLVDYKNYKHIVGRSEDLRAKFEINSNLNRSSLIMYNHNQTEVFANYELQCKGSL